MKQKFFLVLLFFSFISCITSFTSKIDYKETLIVNFSKIISHGHFEFFVFSEEENKVIRISFSYFIDLKNQKALCSKIGEEILSKKEFETCIKNMRFRNSEDFRKTHVDSWREKYYKCFSEDFLDITNTEKIKVLSELSKE